MSDSFQEPAAGDLWVKFKQACHQEAQLCCPTCHIYTNLLSGNRDRVAWGFDIDNLAALENLFWAAPQNAEYVRSYEEQFRAIILGKPFVVHDRRNHRSSQLRILEEEQ